MSKNFTLLDLRKADGYYYFPFSKVPHDPKDAKGLLKICDFTGILSDEIQVETMAKIIDKLEALEAKVNNKK